MFISHKYKVIFVHIQRTGGNSIQKLFEIWDPDLIEIIPFNPINNRTKHCFISDIKAVIDSDIFQNYTKFSVVRNPYDRILSWYLMFNQGFGADDATMVIKNSKYMNFFLQVHNFLPKYFRNGQILKYKVILAKFFRKNLTDSEQIAIQYINTGANVMLEVNKNIRCFEDFIKLPIENKLFNRFYINQLDYLSEHEIIIDRILKFENLNNDFNQLATEISFEGKLPHLNKSIRNNSYQSYYNKNIRQEISQRFKRDIEYFSYQFE